MAELPLNRASALSIAGSGAPLCPGDSRPRTFYADAALVLLAFLALVFLGFWSGASIVDLSRSRLTRWSLLVAAAFLIFHLLFRRKSIVPAVCDWLPLLGLFAVYENLKHSHANRITEWLGIAPKDELMARIDRELFGRELPLLFERLSSDWFISIMWFFYFGVYYGGPAFLLGWIYFKKCDYRLFAGLRHMLVLAFLGGYCIYILVPVAGPLFLIGDQFSTPIPSHPAVQTLTFTYRYNWDCFPSLHTAIPWLLTLAVWTTMRPAGRFLCVLSSLGITASTILLRLHYGIDLIAGMVWALSVYAFCRHSSGNRGPA